MFTATLACTADPLTWTDVGAQAGGGLAFVEMVQASVTVPSKPPDGVTVVVNVAEPPAVTVAEAGVGADKEKLPDAAFTVSVRVAEWASDPELPMTVTG